MSEESMIRRPQALRQVAVVQVEKVFWVGSKNVVDGANGVRASGLDWKYLHIQLEPDELPQKGFDHW